MGLLALKRFMSMQRDRRRHRQIKARNGSINSVAQRKYSLYQDDDNPLVIKDWDIQGRTFQRQIIWNHIHSLMPMQDAARAACVSRTFLRCWRCHPNLTFNKKILGLNEDVCGKDEIERKFTSKVGQILKNHSGVGLKKVKLEFDGDNSDAYYFLNSWLQIAVTLEIEELTLVLSSDKEMSLGAFFPVLLLWSSWNLRIATK